MHTKPVLRYFDCRGRAQPMRFFLAHHNVSYTDERIPFTDGWIAWAVMKNDRKLSGPFGKLPVLEWQGQSMTQTNLIASFLQQEIAPVENQRTVDETQHALSEDIGLLYQLLNLDLFAPGADTKDFGDRTLDSLDSSFATYENRLNSGDTVFGRQNNCSIAAFWLLEVWQLTHALFAGRKDALTLKRPMLKQILATLSAEGERLSMIAPPPLFWSARPEEVERLPTVQLQLSGH